MQPPSCEFSSPHMSTSAMWVFDVTGLNSFVDVAACDIRCMYGMYIAPSKISATFKRQNAPTHPRAS